MHNKTNPEQEEQITFAFKKPTIILIVVIIISFGLGTWLGISIGKKSDQNEGAMQKNNISVDPASDITLIEIPLLTTDPILGNPDAPIVIFEFTDFECPFCQKHYDESFQRILDDYGDQIVYVHKDFPIAQIHSGAVPSAIAARCAREQEKFWPYRDLLFENSQNLSPELLVDFADSLGLDMIAFNECQLSDEAFELVNESLALALSINLDATPSFIINGQLLIGAQPYRDFVTLIEQELAKLGE